MSSLSALASQNVRDTLAIAMDHSGEHPAMIVADARSPLARLLADAYCACLPSAQVVWFDSVPPNLIMKEFADLKADALVVLIQSTVFKIPECRIRVELFRRDIKVIEHLNLGRIAPDEIPYYVAALAYDPAYYRGVGHALKARMDVARRVRIESPGEVLYVDSALEPAKLNIGDFEGLKNTGSQFPIGEVFTEAVELDRMHGRVSIYGFADTAFRLNLPEHPITLVVEGGRVVDAVHSTEEFDRVRSIITATDGAVWIREIGFGMNQAFSRERHVADVGAFERVCGVHLSLGARHGVYKKPQFNPREVRFHVDSFVVTERVLLDDEVIFEGGAWRVTADTGPLLSR